VGEYNATIRIRQPAVVPSGSDGLAREVTESDAVELRCRCVRTSQQRAAMAFGVAGVAIYTVRLRTDIPIEAEWQVEVQLDGGWPMWSGTVLGREGQDTVVLTVRKN